jgi:hypothetical protein
MRPPLGSGLLSQICWQIEESHLMDVENSLNGWQRPDSKNELESWFVKYASSPDGWILIL